MADKEGTEVKKKTLSQRQKEEEKREKIEKLNAQRESLGSRLAALPRVGGFIQRYKGFLVPVVLILLGVSILL